MSNLGVLLPCCIVVLPMVTITPPPPTPPPKGRLQIGQGHHLHEPWSSSDLPDELDRKLRSCCPVKWGPKEGS